jgi:hypothetical protein
MTTDNQGRFIELSDIPIRDTVNTPEAWGQPSAGNYIFTVIDDVMYGQITGSYYISTYQPQTSAPVELPQASEMDNLPWLSLAESAFDFWDNEQDAIYDTL